MPTYLSPGVYVEEAPSGSRPIEGVGTAVAAFVGFAEKGPFHTPTLVTNWSQYVQVFGGMVEGTYLANSVYGYFANGGGVAYVVRVGGTPVTGSAGTASGNGQKALPNGAPAKVGTFRAAALSGSATGGEITVEIADAEGDSTGDDQFRLIVHQGGQPAETFQGSFRRRSDNNVVTQVREHSKLIVLEEAAAANALARPANQTVTLPAPAPGTDVVPAGLSVDEFAGDVDSRSGLGGLEAIDEITMVAAPDLMAAYQQGALGLEDVKAAQLALISHCEQMGDRLAILDTPPDLTAQQVRVWRQETAGYDSKYAALYYPWVKVFDPAGGRNALMPPSGLVAGLWSRSDNERGVHKAPANEVLRGVIEVQNNVTKGEQDLLNPIGVNCIRAFPGRGVRVWGARTLSSDPAWRYVNVRRLFNYIEESILLGTQWIVFEPNDQRLWGTIRRNIGAFLTEEWRRGALFGATAADAFYVKCDSETNPPEVIDRGQVVCEIGICPVKPAEFVVFRLSQFSDSTSLVNE